MKFQSTVPQPFSDGRNHFLGFPLCPAVHDDIIGVPLKWHLSIVRRHPPLECVMQKQIGEQWADYAALRRTLRSWNQSPGGQMTSADLMKFEPQRRYATLVAPAVEGTATVTDEIIDLHDRIVGRLFNAAKNKHQAQFQSSGKAINDKVCLYARIGQALIQARPTAGDPFAAIDAVISSKAFAETVAEAQ